MSDLKVVLTLVDDFTQRLTGAETGLKTFGREIEGITSTIAKVSGAFAGLFAIEKINSFMQASEELGEKIEDGARKLGLSNEKYQELSYIAKESGSNLDGMSKAFITLAKEAAKSDSILGVSTHDANGHLKEMGSIFQDVLMKIADIPNPTERAAAAQKIFGKAASDVFNIASQGKEKIAELTQQTKDYGLILGDDTVKKLDEAKKSQDRMEGSLKNLSASFVVAFTPSIVAASNALAKFFTILQGTKDDDKLKNLKNELSNMEKIEFGDGGNIVEKVVYGEKWRQEARRQNLEKEISDIEKKIENSKKKLENSPTVLDDLLNPEKKAKSAKAVVDKFDESKTLEDLPKLPAGFTEDPVKVKEEEDKRLQKIEEKRLAFEKGMAEAHIANMQDVQNAGDDLAKDQEKIDDEAKKRAEERAATEQKLRDEGLHGIVSNLHTVASKWKEFGTAYKVAAEAENAINTYKAATAAYSSLASVPYVGVALGAAAAGVAIAAGVANGVQIASQQFALGTYNAPGGLSLVGERGPELLNLPRGSQVINNSSTKNMLSGHTFNVVINGSKSTAENLYLELRSGDRGVQKLVDYLTTATK